MIHKKLEMLKNLSIQGTKIMSVTFENNDRISIDGIIFENLPSFYRVILCSRPEIDSCIYTEVWLPENWNGIFVGTGNGGMAGNICYGTLSYYLKQNYATANTDMGTSEGRNRGINNPALWKDFGWRATHIMTEISKQLILALYKKDADYAYFIGASTGGQQALTMAQRFPNAYDGIVAGVPSNNRTMLHTYFLWNYINLKPKNHELLFSKEEIKKITELAIAYFQNMGDGRKGDKFITNPNADDETINKFITYLKRNMGITLKQADALWKVYTGPVTPDGTRRIYNGMPIGSEKFNCGINCCLDDECPYFYPFIWAFGEDYDGYQFDFDKDLDELNDRLGNDLNANSPDLTEFCNHGGKLIIYSGSADPCVPYPDTMNYYNRVVKETKAHVSEYIKYFLFAGKAHGTEGDGVREIITAEKEDILSALRLWREHGKEPKYFIGLNDKYAESTFERKFYSFRSDSNMCPPTCSEYYL